MTEDVGAIVLIANYYEYDFKKMLEELEDKTYDGICWKCDLEKVKEGMPVYIYYSSMPDGINRICLASEILKTDVEPELIRKSFNLDENSQVEKYILISKPKAIVPEQIDQFSFENLKKYNINNLQGKRYLYKQSHKQLLKLLAENTKNIGSKRIITELFGLSCEFAYDKNEIFHSTKHTTFKRENGLEYYESHHFIHRAQHAINNKPMSEFIESKDNIVILCPLCHNRIHYGSIKDKLYMVNKIYEKKKEIIKEKTNITLEQLHNMYLTSYELKKIDKEKNS